MDVNLTLNCNNNCFFCPRHTYLKTVACKTNNERYNDIKSTREISDKIVLSGGEITILKELWRIIYFCKKINFKKIGIITNGRKLKNLEFAERLINAGVKDFAISIYSVNEKIHDLITQSKGSCRETKRGIANMLRLSSKYNISLRVNLVLNYWNFKDILNTLNTLFYWGVRNFILAEQIIINKKTKYLNLKEIVNFLGNIKRIDFKDARLCVRGFPLCFFKERRSLDDGQQILKYKNPLIIIERQEIDTLVKNISLKNKYFKRFKKLFTQRENCLDCFYKSRCLGIQKAYL